MRPDPVVYQGWTCNYVEADYMPRLDMQLGCVKQSFVYRIDIQVNRGYVSKVNMQLDWSELHV